jgi:uncharacterized protein (TIGR00730 family)
MPKYEINDLAKEESWRMFRIIGELVEGFDTLTGMEPAVTIYGSARLSPDDPLYAKTEEIAYRLGNLGFSIFTGGGPGVMEAANKGALRSESTSVGLNIDIPQEQMLNQYTDLSIMFHHFFVRKVMLVKYASAFICMPGGLGTLDELTEVLTLIQTQKMRPFPVVLVDSLYWKGFLDWLKDTLLVKGSISARDLDLIKVCDEPDDVIEIVRNWYNSQEAAEKHPLK